MFGRKNRPAPNAALEGQPASKASASSPSDPLADGPAAEAPASMLPPLHEAPQIGMDGIPRGELAEEMKAANAAARKLRDTPEISDDDAEGQAEIAPEGADGEASVDAETAPGEPEIIYVNAEDYDYLGDLAIFLFALGFPQGDDDVADAAELMECEAQFDDSYVEKDGTVYWSFPERDCDFQFVNDELVAVHLRVIPDPLNTNYPGACYPAKFVDGISDRPTRAEILALFPEATQEDDDVVLVTDLGVILFSVVEGRVVMVTITEE